MSDYFNTEDERVLSSLIRIGTVSALDEANARVKVSAAGFESDWVPWTTSRAGATRTWSAPRPGEQVVLLCPYGDPAQGVVIPSIYKNAHPAPASNKDLEAVVFPDGTRCEYDSAQNKLQIDVAGAGVVVINCKKSTVNCETSEVNATTSATLTTPVTTVKSSSLVKVEAPETTLTGHLTVQGGINVSGGSGNVFTGNIEMNGWLHASQDIVGAGTSLHSHTHPGDSGGTTGVPN